LPQTSMPGIGVRSSPDHGSASSFVKKRKYGPSTARIEHPAAANALI